MKCRKVIKDANGSYNIVWFGSYGKNGNKEEDAPAIKWNEGKENYAERQEGIASSLIQKLSIIKGELPYDPNYGIPLFDKIKDKSIMDGIIVDIILSHNDVKSIKEFSSKVINGVYTIENLKIISIYNEVLDIYSI